MNTQQQMKKGVVLNSALFDFDEERKQFVAELSDFTGKAHVLHRQIFEDVPEYGFALNTPDGTVAFVPGGQLLGDGEVLGFKFIDYSKQTSYCVLLLND